MFRTSKGSLSGMGDDKNRVWWSESMASESAAVPFFGGAKKERDRDGEGCRGLEAQC